MVNQIEPYLGYGAIDALRTIFNSNYNSLQAKVTKRFSGSTYVDANITWSRDLTNAPADYSGFIQNEYNINGDYGRASLDRNKVFNFDGVFEEPWFREQKDLVGRAAGRMGDELHLHHRFGTAVHGCSKRGKHDFL